MNCEGLRALAPRRVIGAIAVSWPLLFAACGGAASTTPPAAASSTAPSARAPLLVEYVVLRQRWVERFVPDPSETAGPTSAADLTRRLGADLLARLKTSAAARTAIADSVDAVLGERAKSDADRPSAVTIERELVTRVRLPAAAKAALETFARGARAGDVLPSPAVDADVVVVARAVAPGASRRE